MHIKFLMTIILLMTLLVGEHINANPEFSNQDISLRLINDQLNKYCLNCQKESLSNFITVVRKLENKIDSLKKHQEFQEYQLLLAKTYRHLAIKFFINDDVNFELYLTKELEILQQILDSNNDRLIKLALKYLQDTFFVHFRAFNKTKKPPYWKKKVNDIQKKYNKKIKLIDGLESFYGLKIKSDNTIKISVDEMDDIKIAKLINELDNINRDFPQLCRQD